MCNTNANVMTVAHCVFEPWRRVWWRGLEFHPGRNVHGGSSDGWSPLGSVQKHDLRLHPNWTKGSLRGQPGADAAIIITATPIGRRLGAFQLGRSGRAADDAADDAASRLQLHIAGYPDNRANGSMWQQCCSVLDRELQGNLLWHDCYARGGNSGSPVWIVRPPENATGAAGGGPGGGCSLQPRGGWDGVEVVGVHSSSLKVPADSQLGQFAADAYAALRAQATSQQEQGSATTGRRRRRALLAGAGGREGEDGEGIVLLPVAVPFTRDTAKWIEGVLAEFARCPGE